MRKSSPYITYHFDYNASAIVNVCLNSFSFRLSIHSNLSKMSICQLSDLCAMNSYTDRQSIRHTTIERAVERQRICCNKLSDDKNIGCCQMVDWICVYDIWLSIFTYASYCCCFYFVFGYCWFKLACQCVRRGCECERSEKVVLEKTIAICYIIWHIAPSTVNWVRQHFYTFRRFLLF